MAEDLDSALQARGCERLRESATITIDRATAQQALEALETYNGSLTHFNEVIDHAPAIAALCAALAQQAEPVQEPVAWMYTDAYNPKVRFLEWTQQAKGYRGDWIKTPLYTARPRYTLSELVKGMQPGDMPPDKEWDAAHPVGREEGPAK